MLPFLEVRRPRSTWEKRGRYGILSEVGGTRSSLYFPFFAHGALDALVELCGEFLGLGKLFRGHSNRQTVTLLCGLFSPFALWVIGRRQVQPGVGLAPSVPI